MKPTLSAFNDRRSLFLLLLATSLLMGLLPMRLLAQKPVLPYPKAGIQFGGYFSGDEFTSGLTNRKVFATGSLFYEMPVYDNLGFNLTVFAGASQNLVPDLNVYKGLKQRYEYFSFETSYAGGVIGPAFWLPEILGDLSTTLYAQAGVISKKTLTRQGSAFTNDRWKPYIAFGLGLALEYPLTENIDLRLNVNGFLTNTDELDGLALGQSNDGFSTASLGFSWRFIDEEKVVVTPGDYFAAAKRPALLPPVMSTLVDASLKVKQFASFDELRQDPRLVTLYLGREGAGKLPAQVLVEVLHGGRRIAYSSRIITMFERFESFDASAFIDLDHIAIVEGYEQRFPSGKYEVNAVVVPASQGLTFNARGSFQTVDLEEFFGENKAEVKELLDKNLATVTTTDDNKLVIQMFPTGEATSPMAGEPSSVPTQAQWEGTDAAATPADSVAQLASRREKLRDVFQLVPEAPRPEREQVIERTSQRAFNNAVSLIRTVKPKGRTSAVIAVIYFPLNGAILSTEGKITLDNVARQFRSHPNLRVELRGYSSDFTDDVWNERLSEQRSQRVYDYLARKIVPTSLIRNVENAAVPPETASTDKAPLYRKVEIALIEDEEMNAKRLDDSSGTGTEAR